MIIMKLSSTNNSRKWSSKLISYFHIYFKAESWDNSNDTFATQEYIQIVLSMIYLVNLPLNLHFAIGRAIWKLLVFTGKTILGD